MVTQVWSAQRADLNRQLQIAEQEYLNPPKGSTPTASGASPIHDSLAITRRNAASNAAPVWMAPSSVQTQSVVSLGGIKPSELLAVLRSLKWSESEKEERVKQLLRQALVADAKRYIADVLEHLGLVG